MTEHRTKRNGRLTRHIVLALCCGAIVGLVVGLAVLAWSVRLPGEWDRLTMGSTETQVEAVMQSGAGWVDRGWDGEKTVYELQRAIGTWTIAVWYFDDQTVWRAGCSYEVPALHGLLDRGRIKHF
jgi:hypothetical protein